MYVQGYLQGSENGRVVTNGGQVTFGSHVTTTKKKARGKSRACAEHTSGQGHFRSRDFVTSGQ